MLTVQRLQEQQQEHFAMLKTLSSENRSLKLEITELRMTRLHIPEDNMEEEQLIPRVISKSTYHRNADPRRQNPEQYQPDEDLHEHRSRRTEMRDDHQTPEHKSQHAEPEEKHRNPEHKRRQTRRKSKHQNPENEPQDTRMDDRYQNTEYDDPEYNPRVKLSDEDEEGVGSSNDTLDKPDPPKRPRRHLASKITVPRNSTPRMRKKRKTYPEIKRMQRELDELKATMFQLPGAPIPFEKNDPSSYADSPFIESISRAKLPSRLVYPAITPYDGSTDPDHHMAHYKQRMFAITVPEKVHEACTCRGFGMSLTGPALK